MNEPYESRLNQAHIMMNYDAIFNALGEDLFNLRKRSQSDRASDLETL